MGTTEIRRIGLGSALAASIVAASALAGAPSADIERPFVFPGAEVNTVVMPYAFAGDSELIESTTGNQLSLLVHFDTLFSMMKYRSIGGVRLVGEPDDPDAPDADGISAMLLGRERGAVEEVAPGHGMVLLWGRLYEEGDHIFLQSYLRFVRRDRDEVVPVDVLGQGFTGWLPARGVAFPPRELTRQQLGEIRDAFSASARVRPQRDESLSGEPLPLDVGEGTAFWITDAREGWLKISGQHGRRRGLGAGVHRPGQAAAAAGDAGTRVRGRRRGLPVGAGAQRAGRLEGGGTVGQSPAPRPWRPTASWRATARARRSRRWPCRGRCRGA